MSSNVNKRSKQGFSGDNKGVRLVPSVCPPVDYSRDIATLVFLYFRNFERFRAKEITPDQSWFIFNDLEGEILNGLSPSSDIPGYRPIGYAHGKSPVREKTFGEVVQALMTLQDDHPSSHAILREQLDEKAGKELGDEWDRVAKLHQTAQELRRKAEEYETLVRFDKRMKIDPGRHDRFAKDLRARLERIESTKPEDVMPLYHQVLTAAALLKPHLW